VAIVVFLLFAAIAAWLASRTVSGSARGWGEGVALALLTLPPLVAAFCLWRASSGPDGTAATS
jgi:ABC-type Fe3+ transport system permease subunit